MKEMLQRADSRDWRWLIIAIAFCYVVIVFGASKFGGFSEHQLLQGLGVPALEHPFMDMRGVACWCDGAAAGHDPSVEQTWINFPGEASHPNYLMNYSPLVLCLGKLGLTQHSVIGWSVACGVVFATSLLFLCGSCSLTNALIWALLICSPTSVLVVERGNLDTVLFAMLVVALLLRRHPFAESGVILFASLFKFFPIGALVASWKDRGKRGNAPVILSVVLFSLFLLLLRSRLASIGGSLTGQFQSAFGCGVMVDLLFHHGIVPEAQVAGLHRIFHFIAWIVFGMTFLVGWRQSGGAKQQSVSERSYHAFFLGAPIMLGLFLIGNQMDYKWLFFLLLVPASLESMEHSVGVGASAAKLWMASMVSYSYWTFFSDEGSLRNAVLKQLLMWLVMILTAFLAGRLWNRKSEQ